MNEPGRSRKQGARQSGATARGQEVKTAVETPRTVEEFVAEATREAKVAQDALGQYANELADATRVYLVEWMATQQAGLRVSYDLQNAMILASRNMLDATSQASRALVEQWTEAAQRNQITLANLVAAGARMLEGAIPARQ